MRFRIDLAYDGAGFSGWATQPGLRTVQGELECWLPRVLRLDAPTPLTVAGRTDAGVHARGQVAHVDLPADTDPDRLTRRLRRVLPADITIAAVRPAAPGFDARFSALWRRYAYRLSDRPADPLLRNQVVAVPGPLDPEAMSEAGSRLLGLRDFAAFCKRRDGASTVRTLLELHAERIADGPFAGVVELRVRADAFCHSMVRSLAGALVAVGQGRRDLAWLDAAGAATARPSSIQVMPAHGLTLEEVGYPPDDRMGARADEARAYRQPPETGPGDGQELR
ncbi:tRNA pseudouridine(38-40) synthase TruA [Naumannella cuiyingiana]|uniref:tRNA pseudouridine synthase A n=1 Tax=Naumannella cuiyingiana TaxID=1347891 RepID=A0A7Z0IKC2_9ACTN|nr:tRNA pseudouridine(38-40) synthase TruA [Naumannella cuiyingiana]NYI70371.1 tRNA pseudouridine38-40 synthase [Naumannella cuiyingiana]